MTTQPSTTSTTTQPTTSTTTSVTTLPTTSTTTQPSTSSTTALSTTTKTTTITTQPITISTTTTSMVTNNFSTSPISEEPPVNVSELRDLLLKDAATQSSRLISVDTLDNVLHDANKLIEYAKQQISQNQSEFIDDVNLITRLIKVISKQVYDIFQNSSDDTIRFEMSSIKLQIDLVSK